MMMRRVDFITVIRRCLDGFVGKRGMRYANDENQLTSDPLAHVATMALHANGGFCGR